MKRARRFPQRLVRRTGLCVCLALVLTSLAMGPLPFVSGKVSATQGQGNQESGNGKARKVTPEPPQPGAMPTTMGQQHLPVLVPRRRRRTNSHSLSSSTRVLPQETVFASVNESAKQRSS